MERRRRIGLRRPPKTAKMASILKRIRRRRR
jgi:hypothetical protein